MTRAATATLEKSPLDEFKAHCFWRFNAKKKDANIVKAVASGGEFVDFVALVSGVGRREYLKMCFAPFGDEFSDLIL